MPFLRLLRIFVPLLIIAAIVAGAAVVLSSRSDLQSARRDVGNAWKPLRAALDTRYGTLATADNAVSSTPGPLHQLVEQVDHADANWRTLESSGGSVASQVQAANELEALGRQLVLTAHATPRLVGDTTALAAVDAYAKQATPTAAAATFNAAVSRYQRERTRPARRFASGVLGYNSIPAYDASGAA